MPESNFSNPIVATDQLPTILNLEHNSLSEKYAPLNRLINLSVTLVICVIVLVVYFQPFVALPQGLHSFLPYFIWAVAFLGLLLTWFTHARDHVKSYTLRELDLHYTSGLFFRKVVSQPITRIQHIELKRGPFERKVGLARLQVFSAGGEMHTFEIPGLPVEKAQQLRQFILQHRDVVKHG
ncbi:PH domain-containing protein [uncultured Paraglaciecola sp.]|uniref:PH domain-containing protein n=1 Tax=uncultured Paraglaciecola sp. TaxID=1765024 RepID=UPI0030DBC479|tara:strand:+ start:78493 stop:79035 length:543 start_codon:yes stop_codon:yes gene_type:complete